MDTELHRVLEQTHKQAVLETVQQLPGDATFDDILEQIALLALLHRGVDDLGKEKQKRKKQSAEHDSERDTEDTAEDEAPQDKQ